MRRLKIKVGDKVRVILGKDRGREGVVKRVLLKKGMVVVEGLNIIKKHVKGKGIIEKEAPIWASKVMVICPHCNRPTRVGYLIDKKGDKFRLCRRCQQLLDKLKKEGG